MRIAETRQLRLFHPQAKFAAIEHVQWSLKRMAAHVEAGRCVSAHRGLVSDLATYRGEIDDLSGFGIPQLCTAIDLGYAAVGRCLDEHHLLQLSERELVLRGAARQSTRSGV